VPANTTRSFDVTFSPDSAKNFESTLSIKSTAQTGVSYVTIKGAGAIAPAPLVTAPANINVRSSSSISIPVSSTYAVSFTAKGLPRGLSIDSKTGLISGSSSAPGIYNVTITATNPWGITSSAFKIVIDPVAPSLQGDYTGTIGRTSEVNDNFGGIIQLKVSANGSYSGTIVMGRQTIPIRGLASGLSGSNPIIDQVTVSPNGSRYSVKLEFMPDQSITGTLAFNLPGSETAIVSGWRNSWATGSFPSSGIFNHRVSLATATVGDLTIPQGHGYFSQNVSTKGKASTMGVTAEGQRFTSSSDIGFAGQFTVWSLTHSRRGVVQAFGTITASTATGSGFAIKTLFEPITGRLYRDGYGIATPVDFVTLGGLYVPPTVTTAYLGKTPGSAAVISFSHANVGSSQTNPTTSITLGELGKMTIPTSGSVQNPSGLSLKINPRNGMVTGRMTLTDANRIEPFSPYRRVISFNGLVEPSTNAAYGYFLLNQLPPLKGLPIPLNRTSLLSGSWVLQ
jgi:hypothetical protein